MSNNFYALVLAGGSGTRFWPLSRREKPKQLLALFNENTKAVAGASAEEHFCGTGQERYRRGDRSWSWSHRRPRFGCDDGRTPGRSSD